jgi:predicted nucleic acid-binding protein
VKRSPPSSPASRGLQIWRNGLVRFCGRSSPTLDDPGGQRPPRGRRQPYGRPSHSVCGGAGECQAPAFLPGLVIAEVSYLLARDAGSTVEAEFLRSFSTGFLTVVDLTASDLERSADLVEQYSDLPLGATDACLVALAERLGIAEPSNSGSAALQRRAPPPRRHAHPHSIATQGWVEAETLLSEDRLTPSVHRHGASPRPSDAQGT